ncbi:PIG-L deacetylase family protein [Nocardioides sp. SR21]|uniref:PIG-L deacetylase family protein n=1 Tax=Nocardioides sp. SR21 TaxID=2919501 RepID=UPI001FAB039B|nr:PIG-L family deacetylase [Nocardioides sp. SR21]
MIDFDRLGTVLTVWAHPDDETYLVGGLTAALRDSGNRVVCVTATRGEAADPDATPGERAALARRRTAELEDALAVLGVAEHHWLDHADGHCAEDDPVGAAEKLRCLVDEVRPDTVITFGPDGFTGHPDHRAVSRWVDLALRGDAGPRLLHAVMVEPAVDPELDSDFGVFELGRPRICSVDELAVHLPLSGHLLDRKVAALLLQESQTAGLVSAVGIERFRAWVATEYLAEPRQTG